MIKYLIAILKVGIFQVLDAGEIIEFDEPYLLLQNIDGLFRKLVNQTGQQMETKLNLLAKEFYFNKLNKHDDKFANFQ